MGNNLNIYNVSANQFTLIIIAKNKKKAELILKSWQDIENKVKNVFHPVGYFAFKKSYLFKNRRLKNEDFENNEINLVGISRVLDI